MRRFHISLYLRLLTFPFFLQMIRTSRVCQSNFLEAFFCTSSMFHDWQILTKVMLLWPDIFFKFQWIDWSEITVLYLYLVVWGVTDWAFPVWGNNCTNSVDLCHFSCFLAQLSPPAIWGDSTPLLWKDYQSWQLQQCTMCWKWSKNTQYTLLLSPGTEQ